MNAAAASTSASASIDGLVLRLSPGVVFTAGGDGRPRAEIARGASTTRFSIDAHIQTVLECFRQPRTLQQAATTLAAQGFAPENVLQFGKAMLKTPLLEFHDEALPVPDAQDILEQAGLELLTAFKDRKFDGVYQVRERGGADRIVKLLRGPASMGVSQRVLRRLEYEYAVLRRLDRVPAVPRAGRFVAAPYPYFDMEYVAGATLTDHVMARRSWPERTALARQALTALAAVHACGVIHGDLHTSNFLVEPGGRLRLIDFDCSFVHGDDFVPRVGGAVHFMPPERMAADWHALREVVPGFASDIYQLGIILYFILSGTPPYRGSQYAALASAIGRGDYPALTRSREGEPVPAALAQAVAQCMAHDPALRASALDPILSTFLACA